MMNQRDLKDIFSYHPPFGDQAHRYEQIRAWGHTLATNILALTPASPEQTLAIRHVQQAVMHANAAIAIHEKPQASKDEHPEVDR